MRERQRRQRERRVRDKETREEKKGNRDRQRDRNVKGQEEEKDILRFSFGQTLSRQIPRCNECCEKISV